MIYLEWRLSYWIKVGKTYRYLHFTNINQPKLGLNFKTWCHIKCYSWIISPKDQVKFWDIFIWFFRLRRKRNKTKKYGLITGRGADYEMAPLDADDDDDDEDTTVFEMNRRKKWNMTKVILYYLRIIFLHTMVFILQKFSSLPVGIKLSIWVHSPDVLGGL